MKYQNELLSSIEKGENCKLEFTSCMWLRLIANICYDISFVYEKINSLKFRNASAYLGIFHLEL